jgi:uncharacterized protein involved in response to NO
MTSQAHTTIAFAYPFRIFFILTGAYALSLIAGWILFLFAAWPLPLGWAPMQWHSHEMIYGFVTAAIAGFVLTAMTNWTGAPPLRGRNLALLALLWFAGRAVMWLASWLPGWLVAVVDLAFLPVLAGYIATVLLKHNNRRNLILVAVLVLLWAGNLLMHIGFASGKTAFLQAGQLFGLDLVTVLIVIIAGRITPLFTANWLTKSGRDTSVIKRVQWVEIGALVSIFALLLTDVLPVPAAVIGGVALVAATFNAWRLMLWRGWLTLKEPLLWILHLSYFWLVLALLLRGMSLFFPAIPPSLWQHTLGVGAIASLILGVMTRVSMGHTGRPLQLIKLGVWIYVMISLATVFRIMVPLGVLNFHFGILSASAAWILAFTFFLILYAPVLLHPRVDGRPG